MRHARLYYKPLLFLDWTLAMHYYIISPPPLSDKQPTESAVCWYSLPKGTYNACFVSAAMVSCTFQITKPVSHNHSTEWNSTAVSKQSDPKVYTSVNARIWVLFTFDSTKKPQNNIWREIIPSISSQVLE